MIKRVVKLFQIARKLSTSGAIEIIDDVQLPTLNIAFSFLSFGSSSTKIDKEITSGENLCLALQGMGTTFIKLGQF